MQFKNVKGVWLPKDEAHLTGFADQENWRYQGHKLDTALKEVTNFHTAIDIGGHCGLWSKELVKRFERVFAFEPIPLHRECFALNCPQAELLPFALGEVEQKVKFDWQKENTGNTHINKNGTIEAEMRTLDSFNIENVGFIKLDCEGYEYFALKGGENTIRKWHPVIIVEQKPHKGYLYNIDDTKGSHWLRETFGYKLIKVIAGDHILG